MWTGVLFRDICAWWTLGARVGTRPFPALFCLSSCCYKVIYLLVAGFVYILAVAGFIYLQFFLLQSFSTLLLLQDLSTFLSSWCWIYLPCCCIIFLPCCCCRFIFSCYMVYLPCCRVFRAGEVTEKEATWTFKLVHVSPDYRSYLFSASSEKEMLFWMKLLKQEMLRANGKLSR